MGKDSYWFRHDSTASRDLKLMKIRIIYDFWGIGIYWTLIEFLREQKDYKYEYSESNMQILCDIIGCKDLSKFNNFIKDSVKFDLFKVENNQFFSQSLINRMSKWETCKANGSKPKIPKEQPEEKPNGSQTEAKRKPNGSQIEAKSKPNGSIIEEENIYKKKKDNKASFISFDKFVSLVKESVTNEKLIEALNNYFQMRESVKKPMTEYAVKLQIKKLRSWFDNKILVTDIIESINKSIVNLWTDIYEPKQNNQ